MRGEVEVGAISDTFQFAELAAPKLEAVLDVDRALGVVRQLLLRMFKASQVLFAEPKVAIPVPALFDPVLVPFLVGARLDEELHFGR